MDDADVFTAHAPAVRAYCRSRLRQRPDLDVEDAVQETFIQWLRRSDRAVDNPEAWLIHAARFVCYHMLTRGPRDVLDEDPGRHDRDAGDDPAVAVADAAWLGEVLRRLSPQHAEILRRLYLDDWDSSRLATHLGVTVEHLRVLKHRALLKARAVADEIGRGLGALVPGFVPRGWARFRRRLHDALRRPGTRRAAEQLGTYPIAVEATAAMLILLAPAVAAAARDLPGPWYGDTPALSLAASSGTASNSATPPAGGPHTDGQQDAALSQADHRAAVLGSTSGPALPHGGVNGLTSEILPPGPGITQQDAKFSSLTASPAYATDGTVFASGQAIPCVSACSVLFRSPDRGTTWQHLDALAFVGGRVVLPPTYPADPTIFAAGSLGLQRSDDGGHSFRVVVPTTASVASAYPGDGPGQARILVGAFPLLVYHENGLVTAGPSLPAGMVSIDDVGAVSSTDAVVVGKQANPLAPGQQQAVVLHCGATSCAAVMTLPAGTLSIAVSPSVAADHAVSVTMGTTIRVSHDGGLSYDAPAPLPVAAINAVAFSPAFAATSTLYVVGLPSTLAAPSLYVSHDAGSTLIALAGNGLPPAMVLSTVVALPDGHLIAALTVRASATGFGLRCSVDGGSSWQISC